MRADGTDAVGMLRWGLRRYWAPFLLCVLLGAVVAPLAAANRSTTTDATALVVAENRVVELAALPRYGEQVFTNGNVAQALVDEFEDMGAQEDVIPRKVSLVAEQDTIIFEVVGHDVDPERAAAIANTAADAFVEALNAAGATVGEFALQSEAEVPHKPGTGLGTVFAAPVGLVAGAVLGLALIAALLVFRRPVIEGADAEEATGVLSLGTVTVPRTRRSRFAPAEDFGGLVPVCRRLLALPTPTVVMVSRPRESWIRTHLTVAMAKVLGLIADIRVVGGQDVESMVADSVTVEAENPVSGTRPGNGPRLTLVDGSDLPTLVHPPLTTATVLVVPEGIGGAALRAAVVEHLGGSAEARLLMVRRGRRRKGLRVPAGRPAHRMAERQPAAAADGR
jgi:capsular polysaccharide biosynthesis protein